jgi:hypothetical protein
MQDIMPNSIFHSTCLLFNYVFTCIYLLNYIYTKNILFIISLYLRNYRIYVIKKIKNKNMFLAHAPFFATAVDKK